MPLAVTVEESTYIVGTQCPLHRPMSNLLCHYIQDISGCTKAPIAANILPGRNLHISLRETSATMVQTDEHGLDWG